MKKFLFVLTSVMLSALILISGCATDGKDGRDGKDGQNVSIYEVYEEAKKVAGNENLTFDEFLHLYLNYTDSQINLKATINRSLLSGVTILSRFGYTSSIGGTHLFPGSSQTSYNVYTGSGAILWMNSAKTDAYVVTNCHVVYDDTSDNKFSKDVRLYLYGQDESGVNFTLDSAGNINDDNNYCIPAEIIGASVTYDIALLKITGSDVLRRSDAVVATFSPSETVYVGETVYAVGNASGEGMSASNGIISKDSEYIDLTLSEKDYVSDSDYVSYRVMRTTAPINHGNSGGALYNSNGEIVGIVNAKDEGEEIDNMGYALPGNSVKRLLKLMYDSYVSNGNSMKSGGGIDKAFLNIETAVTDSYARYDNDSGVAEIKETVKVNKVSGSPANGKLQAGDVIKAVKILSSDATVKEDIKVTRRYQVPELLFSVRSGDTVIITVERGGVDTDVSIIFDNSRYFKSFD